MGKDRWCLQRGRGVKEGLALLDFIKGLFRGNPFRVSDVLLDLFRLFAFQSNPPPTKKLVR